MFIKNSAIFFLILVLLSVFIGVTPADTMKNPVILNVSEFVNASADTSDALDNARNRDIAVAGTIRWSDKTTVSGKIKIFLKDFKIDKASNSLNA